MLKGYEMTTKVEIKLRTGGIITAEIATIDELCVIGPIVDALKTAGVIVEDATMIRSRDVTSEFLQKLGTMAKA